MEWAYVAQGMGMGLAYVAPIGMQNFFVINSALGQTAGRAALITLAVIIFDISLALACFWGIGLLLERSVWLRLCMLAVGSLLLLRIGWQVWRAEAQAEVSSKESMPLPRAVLMACVVTWLNPQAVLDGTMMLGAFRVALPEAAGLAFLTGVCAASCLWFSCLSGAVRLGRDWITPTLLRRVNAVCGGVIILYALKLLWTFGVMVTG